MNYKLLFVGTALGVLSSISHAQVLTPEYATQWGLAMINADRAFEAGYFGSSVTISVFDTAMDIDHPEFDGRIVSSYDMYTTGPITGWDGTHGTHVGGIIGAARDDVGMMGVAPSVHLVPVRLLDSVGGIYPSGIIQYSDLDALSPAAFDFAIDQGVTAINHSWGGSTKVTDPGAPAWIAATFPNFLDAVRDTADARILNVWATMNNYETEPQFLSALPYLYPELQSTWIAVTALDPDGSKAAYANACGVAAQWCIAAPGSDIFSTYPVAEGSYATISGTSMATPHVTGAVAIAKEIFPDATGPELAQVVFQTATDIGTVGIDNVFGWGLLNLGNVVETVDPQTASVFAGASWSRFTVLQNIASAIPHQGGGAVAFPGDELGALTSFWPVSGGKAKFADVEGDKLLPAGIWTTAFYGVSDLAAGPGHPGSESKTAGALIGIDLVASDMHRLGLAAGFSKTDLNGDMSGNFADEHGYHLLAYGDWKNESWFASGIGQLAYFDQSITRSDISGAQGTSLTPIGSSSPSTWAGELNARVGAVWTSGGSEVVPYVAAIARWQKTGAFSETGAGIFSLSVPETSLAQFEIGPGVRLLSRVTLIGSLVARASFDISYSYLAGDRDHQTNASLLGSRIAGTTAEVGENILSIGTDIKVAGNNGNTSAIISYDGLFQDNVSRHTVSAGVRQAF